MAATEILLLQPVEGLGSEGDQVKVKAGYARNYLFPQKLAVPLTEAGARRIEALKKRRAAREATQLQQAQELATRFAQLNIAFAVKTGEGGKMFGSVTAGDLHERIAAAGIEVDRKRILLDAPVRTLGRHQARIRLHAEVMVELGFDVVSENPIEPPAA
jgi:large subunit ribosomal protein L9